MQHIRLDQTRCTCEVEDALRSRVEHPVGQPARCRRDILVRSRRDTQAAKRLLRKLLKKQCRAPRVMITDELASCGMAKREVILPPVFHRRCRWNLCRLRPRSSTGSTKG